MNAIPELYSVEPIQPRQTHEWLTKKHYMYRVPLIMHAFGLYRTEDNILQGVCTYGWPARCLQNGYGLFGKDENYQVVTFELNRLCVNDGLPKNALSYFVSQTFTLLPKPCCLVSYADGNAGHHGYIYQSTNWIYTGETKSEKIFINKNTGKPIHRRTLSDILGHVIMDELPDWIEVSEEESGKYRYLQFLGDKKQRKDMLKHLSYPIVKEYPKGDNRRYDAGGNVDVQVPLFGANVDVVEAKHRVQKKKKTVVDNTEQLSMF